MRKLKGKKVVRRSKRRKTVIASSASLPPQIPHEPAPAAPSSTTSPEEAQPPKEPNKDFWKLDKGSRQYEQAQKVLAMKLTGMTAAAIAEALDCSKQTVHNLTYLAGKNGWMQEFANAREQIEYRIMPKALRVIEDGLDDTVRHSTSGQTVAQQIALDVAGGTIFKSFEQSAGVAAPVNNVIGITIQTVPGGVTTMREGSGGDTPAYIDGETSDGPVGPDE